MGGTVIFSGKAPLPAPLLPWRRINKFFFFKIELILSTTFQNIWLFYLLWGLCMIIRNVKVLPITGHEGPEGEYRYSPTFSWPRHLDGVGGQHHAPVALPPGKDPVTIVQEAGWAPGPVWTGAENLTTGIRSLDRPTRSESLYRLSYRGPYVIIEYKLLKYRIETCIYSYVICNGRKQFAFL